MPKAKREGPWLGKRGPKYYAFWYDKDSRQRRGLSLDTKEEAEAQTRFAHFLLEGQDLREPTNSPASVAKLSAILEYYKVHHVEVKVADIRRCDCCDRALMAFFGDVKVSSIGASSIGASESQAFIRSRTRDGMKPGSIRREMTHLISACNFARRHRLISADDMPVVDKPAAPDPKQQWLFKDELELLRNAASEDQDTSDFIETLYWTGSRIGAVVELTADQVGLDSRIIKLNPEGRKVTRKRRPSVPIVKELEPIIKRRLDLAGEDGQLFKGTIGKWQIRFVRLAENVGLRHLPARDGRPSGTMTPHTIRHTRATHLLLCSTVSISTLSRNF